MKILTIIYTGLLITLLIFFYFYSYIDIKQNVYDEFKNEEIKVHKFLEDSLKTLNPANFNDLKIIIDTLLKNTILNGIEISSKEFKFNDNDLIKMTGTLNTDWSIDDVTVDIKSGQIQKLENGYYQFNPSVSYKQTEPIKIKFYAYNDEKIENHFVDLEFYYLMGDIEKENLEKYTIENNKILIKYNLNKTQFIKKLDNQFKDYAYKSTSLLLLTTLLLYLFYISIIRKYFDNRIIEIDHYLQAMIEKKFQTLPSLENGPKYIQNVYSHLKLLSQDFSHLNNELSVARDIIEKREITDEQTGLPNKKWFEKDLKKMFTGNKEGYIVFFKIDKLGDFAKKHGGETVNALVRDIAKTIETYFVTNREIDGRCYRFFGAEFALIIYETDAQKVKMILQQIITTTVSLDDKYYFFDNKIYYGASPFDKYGTLESILQSAKDEYNALYEKKEELYRVLDKSEQIEKNKLLEESVKDIISRDDFALQYVYDTYDFNETPRLILQEISPMLIDFRTYDRFPIGVFISVAEKMGIATEFDKLLIKKVLSHIEMAELEHKIAINLSIGSISSMLFLSWLSSTLAHNRYANRLVFVATAYNIASNFELFKKLTQTAHTFGIEIMIKRYDINDLSLELLKDLSPDYIRIDSDYCSDIKRDNTKLHVIKQVLFIADDFNIKVLGDSVRNDIDYNTIEKLGFYGTSR